jgi:structural maintenance of chromosome 4
MKELEKVKSKHASTLEELNGSIAKLDSQIKGLQAKILQVGGVALRAQKSKVDTLQEQIETTQERITKLKVERATREKQFAKSTKNLEKKTSEMQECEEELQRVEKEMEEKLQNAVLVKQRVDEAKHALEAYHEKLSEIKTTLDEREAVIKELRVLEVGILLQMCEDMTTNEPHSFTTTG